MATQNYLKERKRSRLNMQGVSLITTDPNWEVETSVDSVGSSVTVNIYYRKFGKLYVFGTLGSGGAASVNTRFKADATTRAKIATALGITEADYYQSRSNTSGSYNYYWNGSNWVYNNTGTRVLYAMLAV